MASPTQRTLEYYRSYGIEIDVVERWIPQARIRKDLFGFIDLVAITDKKTVGVQATSTGNMGARERKILATPAAKIWAAAPDREVLIIGWRKYRRVETSGPFKGKLWRPTERLITYDEFD